MSDQQIVKIQTGASVEQIAASLTAAYYSALAIQLQGGQTLTPTLEAKTKFEVIGKWADILKEIRSNLAELPVR